MSQVCFAILAFVAGTADASRAVRRAYKNGEVSATCTLEFISVDLDDDEEEECTGGDELVQCMVDDGKSGSYVLDEADFDGFKNGDEVTVAMVPTGEKSCVGSPLYKASSVTLLTSSADASLAKQQSTSDSSAKVPYSFLIIRAEYEDLKPECEHGCSHSDLSSQLRTAVESMRNASYGKWPATVETKVITVQMPYKISSLVHRRRGSGDFLSYTEHRNEVYARAGSIANNYTYRAIYAPRVKRSDGESDDKMISGNAVANVACSKSRDPPTYGKCHAWFNPNKGGWQLMAHEFGHNFGLRHAASLVDSRTSSGQIREYGDQRTFMGPSGKGDEPPSLGRHYVAAARDELGWLPSSKTKSMNYNDTGYFKMESLQRTDLQRRRRSSYQAIKIGCPTCHMEWAKQSSSKPDSYIGGDIYVAYSEGIIAVHYMAYARTENWARIDNLGKTTLSDLTGNRLTINFCKTVGFNQAYVGISNRYDGRSSDDYCDDADQNPLD